MNPAATLSRMLLPPSPPPGENGSVGWHKTLVHETRGLFGCLPQEAKPKIGHRQLWAMTKYE
jgi:hypothetical protein